MSLTVTSRVGPAPGFVVVVAVIAVVVCVGCGQEVKPPCETVVEGAATDEVVRAFADLREFAVDDPAGPKLSVPAEDQTFDKDGEAPTFSWSDELAVVTPLLPRRAPELPPPPRTPGWLESIGGLVIGTAHAHLPPVTGGMYLVEVPFGAAAADACPARTLTSELSLTVDEATWSQMRATPKLTLTLTSAYLVEGRVTEGPYRSTRAFSVE